LKGGDVKMVKRYWVTDERSIIQTGVSGHPTKEEAESAKKELVESRSRRSEAAYNREFGRSKNLKVVEGSDKSKEWIHREQIGKVRGIQRLGFKPVKKRGGFW
jgi:hypothetical protein